jgi:hypothetical protein
VFEPRRPSALADRGSLRGIDTEGDEAIERFDELVAGAC